MEYEIVIGLEVHAQLLTKSKMFCGCSTKFGEKPNTQTCPVCLGMPGILPVINKKAIEFVLKTALALNCRINEFCRFARKHYYYPDMPKNYQISQYEQPLAEFGYIDIEVNEVKRRIGIKRVHLEEDVGKLIHAGTIDTAQHSYVDFNRSGIPLMEIVSEPDIRHPEEAAEYMKQLRMILQYLDVCDGNMEEGSLRCDANLSIRPLGSQQFGTKTEVKNMNSFKNVQKALAFEAERQIAHLKEGERIIQETRLWDADKEITLPMRSKEEAHDYRYFPEPDLVPLAIDEIWLNSIKDGLEELPYLRKARFVAEYGIPSYDAEVLTASKAIANYYEKVVQLYPNPKVVSNWVMVELLRELKGQENAIEKCHVSPENLARMLKMIDEGIISSKIAKAVFEEMYATSKSPDLIVKEKGLIQVSDVSLLEEIIEKVVSNNPEAVKDYLGGKERSFGFLVGQVMKATQGKANPQLVNKMLKEKIASLS